MQRKEILSAISEVSDAIAKSGVLGVLGLSRTGKPGPRDIGEQLRALRDYTIIAAGYKPSARALAKIFKLQALEDPETWVKLVGGGDGENGASFILARAATTLQSEVPKIFALLTQESVQSSLSTRGESANTGELDAVRITFVEDDGRFSTVQRLVEGLSACQEIYDGLQRLTGDNSIPLAIGAIDSGSDKSFDLFGAAALMKEFRELIVSLWGLVVFHREHKLGRRLELLASSLPILERVAALEQANRLGREEAQIIKNSFIEGTRKFVAAGVLTEDLEAHATHNPRSLLAPEPKLLTGPALSDQSKPDSNLSGPIPSDDGVARGRKSLMNLSDADLERLARSGGTRYIFASPGLASYRCRPLNSSARHQNTTARFKLKENSMAQCTAPVNGHRTSSATANCPACGSRYGGYRNSYRYGSGYGSSGSLGGDTSYGGANRSSGGGSSRPRWSRTGSSVSYTSAQVASLTSVREAIEALESNRADLRDCFLCHAWADRQGAAKQLHDLLEAAGVRVWFSEKDLGLGVPMMRAIDKGLAASKIGLVLVTPALLKGIPREGVADKELSALLAGNRLVPIVHGTTYVALREVSPMLASRTGLDTSEDSMTVVATKIAELVAVWS